MKILFTFSLRLLAAFLLTKVVLAALGVDTPGWLLGVSLVLVLLTYLLDWWRRSRTVADLDWFVARLLIKMNQLPDKRLPPAAPPEKSPDSEQSKSPLTPL